jgi:hypothetical protein
MLGRNRFDDFLFKVDWHCWLTHSQPQNIDFMPQHTLSRSVHVSISLPSAKLLTPPLVEQGHIQHLQQFLSFSTFISVKI